MPTTQSRAWRPPPSWVDWFGRGRESTRTMAILHYVDGMTLQEVADEVGMSVSGVRKRLRGLRAELHDLVTEEENEITT